jgi:rod shape determining protein RodA
MRLNQKIDYWLLAPVVVLVALGLTTLASINPAFFRSQLISLVVAIIVFIFITRIDYHVFKDVKKPLYIFSLVLLVIVLVIGIESRGAVRWIDLFGIRIQVSEVFKPLLAFAFAGFIAENNNLLVRTFFSSFLLLAPVALLIYLQPDLGNALIYVIVFLLTLFTLGFSMRWFVLLFAPVILSAPLLWNMLHEYQRQRVLTLIDPGNDPSGTSYNTIQALIAIGSGMFLGRGLGEGTQSGLRFLPEKHTDFIFATISEGLGFVGGLIVILAFVFFFYRMYKIFANTNDIYDRTIIICCFFFFLVQFFVNVGMNIGLLPVVGVTLPFVSFGGSSLVSSFIFLAVVSSISVSQKNKRDGSSILSVGRTG